MSVNLLKEDRLVYHDIAGDTCEISLLDADDTDEEDCLSLKAIELDTGYRITVDVDRDAVETLRDSLTCWLETGKLKRDDKAAQDYPVLPEITFTSFIGEKITLSRIGDNLVLRGEESGSKVLRMGPETILGTALIAAHERETLLLQNRNSQVIEEHDKLINNLRGDVSGE